MRRDAKNGALSYKTSAVWKLLPWSKISWKSYKTSGERNRLCCWDLSQESPDRSYNTTWPRSRGN